MLHHIFANKQVAFFMNVEYWFDDDKFFVLRVWSLQYFGHIVPRVFLVFVQQYLTSDIMISKTNFNDLVDSGIVS